MLHGIDFSCNNVALKTVPYKHHLYPFFVFIRRLVEETMQGHQNTKEARTKLQAYKANLGKGVCFSKISK